MLRINRSRWLVLDVLLSGTYGLPYFYTIQEVEIQIKSILLRWIHNLKAVLYGGWFVPFRLFVISRRHNEGAITKRRKDESEKTKRRKRKDEKTKAKRRKDESEKTLNSGLHVFVISLFRLRYFVMSPSLFRYVAFVISSFRLFAFVFSPSGGHALTYFPYDILNHVCLSYLHQVKLCIFIWK